MHIVDSNNNTHEQFEDSNSSCDRLLRFRTLILSKDIDRDIASNIITSLMLLNYHNSEEVISIYILSSGGEVSSFLAIYDAMQMISAPIETICIGEASSAAAILLAAGTKGLRKATANSRIMIHQMQIESPEMNISSSELEAYTKEVNKGKHILTTILARHAGQPFEQVYIDCEKDKYMSAKEAKQYGLIDSIVPYTKKIPPLKKIKKRKKK